MAKNLHGSHETQSTYVTDEANDRYVIFLSGLAHITLPNSTDEIWVRGGKDGLIVAADGQSEFGHVTTYPGGADTVAVQVPWEVAPGYEVLYGGGCREEEMVGI